MTMMGGEKLFEVLGDQILQEGFAQCFERLIFRQVMERINFRLDVNIVL